MIYRAFIDGNANLLKINMRSETPQEAQMIFEACRAAKKPIKAYGGVSTTETWAWFFIPLKQNRDTYFDNGAL
jgi:hypothetical protein